MKFEFRRRLGTLLAKGLGLALFVGCSPKAALTWTDVEALIRRDYPGTPSISTEELARRLASGEAILLVDTRSVEEFAIGHLPGAVPVPDGSDFTTRLSATCPEWRHSETIVLYCSVGYRSARATQRLIGDGFDDALNLTGSIFLWANEGRPLEDDRGPTRRVHDYSDEWGVLLDSELRAR